MSKCETCIHYEYHAGVSSRFNIKNTYTVPTCICKYAQVAWMRSSAAVKKPRGINCNYTKREFTCVDCGSHNIKGALILVSAAGEMVCKRCCEKTYEKEQNHEV